MSSSFKERWEATDKCCENCGQVTEVARGLNKQNLKRLVFGKPSIIDIMLFVIILMTLLMAWRYNIETAQCQEVLYNIDDICAKYQTTYIQPNYSDYNKMAFAALSNIIFNNAT